MVFNANQFDIDLDGAGNSCDAFIFDPTETLDSDGDGVGNNADLDDDNDGLTDSVEIAYGTDPLDPGSFPIIADGDLAPFDNPDGFINAADVFIALQLTLNQRTAGSLQYAHGDMNFDGVIDLVDLKMIQNLVLQN